MVSKDFSKVLPAQIVEILLVESQEDIGEVINVGSTGGPSDTPDHRHEQLPPMLVDQRHQRFNLPVGIKIIKFINKQEYKHREGQIQSLTKRSGRRK